MSLYTKLLLFMVVVALGPLALLSVTLVSSAEDALRTRIERAQAEAVRSEAEAVARFVKDQVHTLGRTASHFVLSESSAQEREKAAQLLYRSSVHVSFAALLYEDGSPAAPVVYYRDPQRAPELLGDPVHYDDLRLHPPSSPELVARAEVPIDAAKQEGAGAYVLSNVYAVPEREEAAFSVALPVRGDGDALLIYVAEVSLGALMHEVIRKQELGTLVVTDATGLAVAHPDPAKLRMDPSPAGTEGILTTSADVPIPHLAWRVAAYLPEDVAFAPIRRLRTKVAAAGTASLVLLLLLAAAFTSRVRAGLRRFVDGAAAFARGDLSHRIDAPPERELKEVALAFNTMGGEIERAREKLLRWNEELEAEVTARTQELKEAQARLVQSQKLAAVGQLGAGVAHEINNPLSGVLGFAQLLKARLKKAGRGDDDPDVALLDKVETNARRCREVTATLLRFSQRGEQHDSGTVDLGRVIKDALALSESQLEEEGVRVTVDVAAPPPEVAGDAGQLVQLLLHLVTNARTAMRGREERSLTIRAQREGQLARLIVEDTGKGMSPEVKERAFEPFFTTKDEWSSLGLGLYASFRIVEDHGGRLELESAPGAGTTVRVELDAAQKLGAEKLREPQSAR